RKDIANYLLENDARLDLFAAAMLGKFEIVKSVLKAYPNAIHVPGPHNISLLEHAKFGGEDASAVYEFLQSLLQKQS
ncbi:MAG: ankyrin repeat domain-containing protein, partial [Anaerolineae bacterium]|nr:ankyrin repeat domain-containing protein [Anaerolineae bacterium]